MNNPDWREVRLAPEVLEKVGRAFRLLDLSADDDDLVRIVFDYVREAFREMWLDLHQSPDDVRSYYFYGDDLPVMVFYARTTETHLYDFAIVEEIVTIFDVQIFGVEES